MIIDTEMVGKTIVKVEVVNDDGIFTQEVRLWINEFEYIRIIGGSTKNTDLFIELTLMGVEENGDRIMLEKEIQTAVPW